VFPHLVIVTIPEYIEPMDRGERYEYPLIERLEETGLGQLTGGGTRMNKASQILSVDLELRLANLDSAVAFCASELESYGAPKGSRMVFGDAPNRTTVGFGKMEGVALVLDGVNLPAEVYEEYGLDELLDVLEPELEGGVGELHGCNTLDETTELYFYGPSADKILEVIAGVQSVVPLCQNSTTRKIEVRTIDGA